MNKTPPIDSDEFVAQWRIPELFPKLTAKQQEQLLILHTELLKSTKGINLISAATAQQADLVHIADSLLASEFILRTPMDAPLYDVYSGNGFPSLVLALMDPTKKIIILERDPRRSEFFKQTSERIGLTNVSVDTRAIETLPPGSIKFAVSRGFLTLSKALLITRQLFTKDGLYFHVKGDTWGSEMAEIPPQIYSLWEPTLLGQYKIPIRNAQMALILAKKLA